MWAQAWRRRPNVFSVVTQDDEPVKVIVSVDDRWARSMGTVAERLAGAGMEVEESMDAIATVTGSIRPSAMPALQALDEVSTVEIERTYQLPPPDADIQ